MSSFPEEKCGRKKHICCSELHCVNSHSQIVHPGLFQGCGSTDAAHMANPGFLPYSSPPPATNDQSSSNEGQQRHWSRESSSEPGEGGDGSKRERNRMRRREERANPSYRDKERAKARLRMQEKRKDPMYREVERLKNRIRMRTLRSKGDEKPNGVAKRNRNRRSVVANEALTKSDQTSMLSISNNNVAVDLVNEYVNNLFK